MFLWDKGWTITNVWLSLEGQIKVIDTKYFVLQILTFLNSDIPKRPQKGLFNLAHGCIVDGDFCLPNEIDS